MRRAAVLPAGHRARARADSASGTAAGIASLRTTDGPADTRARAAAHASRHAAWQSQIGLVQGCRRRDDSRPVNPSPVIIVEGILVFVDPGVRERLDMKIFVDTDPDIRVFRRIRRDMEQRGRTFESIRDQYYRTVRPMHLQFVEPSKRWADLIIPEGGNNRVALDLIIAKLKSVLNSPR